MAVSKIEWTDVVWNPVIGCTKCGLGCQNCYAELMAPRLAYMGNLKYGKVIKWDKEDDIEGKWTPMGWNGKIICDDSVLNYPFELKKPRKIFICSMSDLLHEKVPFEFIDKVMAIIKKCPQHTFQLLTKRTRGLSIYYNNWFDEKVGKEPFPDNVWLGVSVSTQAEADEKIPILLQIPAVVRYVSAEPLLEEIDFQPYCDKLDWIIIGAESGSQRRILSEMDLLATYNLIDSQCPVFVKQIHRDGKLVKMPKDYPQEYPQ